MKQIALTIALTVLFAGIAAADVATQEIAPAYVKLDKPVRKLLAEPRDDAKVVYELPIDVKIVERTKDKKWYKVKISYNFFGYFETEGWARVE